MEFLLNPNIAYVLLVVGFVLTLLAILLGRHQNLSLTEGVEAIRAMETLPDQVQAILSKANQIEAIAAKYYDKSNWLFLGLKVLADIQSAVVVVQCIMLPI